jgi:hypothetical protein
MLAAGFTRQPAEALLVAEIADLTLDVPPPPGIELRGGRSARARARVVDGGVGTASCEPGGGGTVKSLDLAEELDPAASPWNTPDVDSAILDRHRCQGQVDGMRGQQRP